MNAAGARNDVAGAKAALVDLVDHVPSAVKTLVSSLNKAGVPKITNGKKITQTYVNTLHSIAKTITSVKAQLEALPTDNPTAFNSGAQALIKPTGTEAQTANARVQTLDTQGKVYTPLQSCGGVFALSGGSQGGSGGQGGGGGQGGTSGGTSPSPPSAAPPAS